VSLALSLEICLVAFYKVLLRALNLTIGMPPETTPRSGRNRCASLLFHHPHQPSSVVASGNFVYPRIDKDNFYTNDHPTVVTADDNAAILDAVRDLLSASFQDSRSSWGWA
jgi:hypothetical protein